MNTCIEMGFLPATKNKKNKKNKLENGYVYHDQILI